MNQARRGIIRGIITGMTASTFGAFAGCIPPPPPIDPNVSDLKVERRMMANMVEIELATGSAVR